MKKIEILMSTYNGEAYVEEQIKSINENNTDDLEIELLVRDDGSSDRTIEIIEQLKKEMDISICLICGENLGVSKSFLKLFESAQEADLYFLCDQDDVWDKNKIKTIINTIPIHFTTPQLYISGYFLTDARLNVLKECKFAKETKNSLLQILFANMVPGCTMAFNSLLLQELKRDIPENVPMHDIYILATAYCCGEISYIEQPLIYYRQHGNNTEGVQSKKINWKRILRKQIKLLKKKHVYTAELAEEIYHKYQDRLCEEERKELQLAIHYRDSFIAKIDLLRNREIYYPSIRSKLLTIEKILLERF